MVSEISDSASHCHRVVIRANQSMTWKQTVIFLLVTYTMTGMIALVCTLMGFWLVLPFAGMEMLVLTVCLYIVSHRNNLCEVVTVDNKQVVIEQGRYRVQHRQTFIRHWTQVILQAPGHRWYMSRLMLGSHGRHIEIGHYLIEEERIHLANTLKKLIHDN